MNRSRMVFYAVLAAGVLMVGSQAVLASGDTVEAPSPVPATRAPATRDWHVSGTIQAMNGEFWTIRGQVIRVASSTRVRGEIPVVGSVADATGEILPDGTWQANDVQIGHLSSGSESSAAGPAVPPSTPIPTPPAAQAEPAQGQPSTPVPSVRPRRDQRRWPGYGQPDAEPRREGEHWRFRHDDD